MQEMKPMENTEVVVIIPSYEPTENFIAYCRILAKEDISAIVVVNDGSDARFDPIFREIETIEKVTLIAYPDNRGKGSALKTAFGYCKDRFQDGTVYVTADSDGQHTVRDVMRVAAKAATSPERTIVFGCRNFKEPQVPFHNRWGNTLTSLFFRLMHGAKCSDTQTGLRGFGHGLLDYLNGIGGERFEYEMNMLIRATKDRVRIAEITIETVYNEDGKASHFNVVRDSSLVMRSVFGNLGMYFISSVLSAILDVAVFLVLVNFVDIPAILGISAALRTPVSKCVARVLSSIFNIYFNFRFVFHGKGASCIPKYYVLWFFQLIASSLGVTLFIDVLHVYDFVSVMIVDLSLALISYRIQKHWVFRTKEDECTA